MTPLLQGLAGVGAYFAVLIGATLTILTAAVHRLSSSSSSPSSRASTAAVLLYSFSCCAICWRLILRFMTAEVATHASFADFVASDDSTFLKAYVVVTDSREGWFWSSQLLVLVVPLTAHLHFERAAGRLGRALALCHVAAGFLGAISLSWPMLFAYLRCGSDETEGKEKQTRGGGGVVGPRLFSTIAVTSLIGLLSVVLLPVTVGIPRLMPAYVVALTSLHGVLALPSFAISVVGRKAAQNSQPPPTAVLFALIAGAAFAVHAQNVASLLPFVSEEGGLSLGGLLAVGFAHDCQASISADLVFTIVACSAFMATAPGGDGHRGRRLALASPFLSIGCAFSLFLALAETSKKNEDHRRKTR